jgi:hypothetical protein
MHYILHAHRGDVDVEPGMLVQLIQLRHLLFLALLHVIAQVKLRLFLLLSLWHHRLSFHCWVPCNNHGHCCRHRCRRRCRRWCRHLLRPGRCRFHRLWLPLRKACLRVLRL